VLLVIFLAGYLDDKRDLLTSPYKLGPISLPPLPYLAPLLLLWVLALVLFVAQKDLGSALLFFGIFLAMLYVASGRPFYVLAAVHTDMVIAAIGEELGLAGTLAVIALFMLLVYRGYHIALLARTGYEQLLAVGLTTILGLQTIIIIGGAIKMIPLTGITLPFISYGGSSLLVNFAIVGLLHRISAMRGGLTQRLE